MPSTKQLSNATQAVVLMLLSTILLASMHGIVRYLGNDMHPMLIVFFRNLFGLVAIIPLLMRNGIGVLHTSNRLLHGFRAITGIFAMMAFFIALTRVPIANVTALSFSTTLFATLGAAFFLRERIRLRRITAIVVGLVGVVIVLRPSMDGFNVWSLLVLAAAVGWGLSVTVVKKLSRTESSVTIVAWMGITLTLLSLPGAIVYWQSPTLHQLLVLTGVGMLATAGHLLLAEALKHSEVTIVMSIDFTRLIWATIIGFWFFGENIDQYTILGAMVIFGAGWYILFRESRIGKPELPIAGVAGTVANDGTVPIKK